ncbi:MAG: A/G-specific adenine glycosylase [Candidatus Izimaplasma sp.]|nr:A/G-specific adenine glycosylase [Candidatus Izimaplasma bacterium]
MKKTTFNQNLINWFDQYKRDLPWRKSNNPYTIWVSEIMLQQTQVTTVIDYFNRFMTELPTVHDLATCPIDYLLKLWEGLGYYSRARNMHKTAKIIVNQYNGFFPSDYETLLTLPGIGPYTASALMSIVFNKPYAAVDGNVYRVMARFLAIQESIKDPAVKKQIKSEVIARIPKDNPADFTEALMELGATICLPKQTPLCGVCPLQEGCAAYHQNCQDTLPIKQIRKAKKEENRTVLVFVHRGKLAIKKRDDVLLHQLYGFYLSDNPLSLETIKSLWKAYDIKRLTPLSKYTHTFTHLNWQLTSYLIETTLPLNDFHYVSLSTLESNYSLPRAFSKLIPHIKKALGQKLT